MGELERLWREQRALAERLCQAMEPELDPLGSLTVDFGDALTVHLCGPEALRRERARAGISDGQAAAFARGDCLRVVDLYLLGGLHQDGRVLLDQLALGLGLLVIANRRLWGEGAEYDDANDRRLAILADPLGQGHEAAHCLAERITGDPARNRQVDRMLEGI